MVLKYENENELFAQRLNLALDRAGVVNGRGRQTAVGNLFGVSQKGAAKWLRGEGMPKMQRIKHMAERLNVRGEWLLTGSGGMTNHDESSIDKMMLKRPLEGWVPCLNDLQVRRWLLHGGEMKLEEIEKWLPCPIAHSKQTFAIRYHGNSMEPLLHDGELIFIDPDKKPAHNTIVLVQLANGGTTVRTLLVEQDGKQFLKVANDAWPEKVAELTQENRIMGVAIFRGKEL